MTTPNQSPPFGAYQVGGGEFHFGQLITGGIAKLLVIGEDPDPLSSIQYFHDQLMRMPLEALKYFQPFIPGATDEDFKTVPIAVKTIVLWFLSRPLLMTLQMFEDWISDFVEILTGIANGDLTVLGDWFKENITDRLELIGIDLESIQNNIVDFITESELVSALQLIVEAIIGSPGGLDELRAFFAGFGGPDGLLGLINGLISDLTSGTTEVISGISGALIDGSTSFFVFLTGLFEAFSNPIGLDFPGTSLIANILNAGRGINRQAQDAAATAHTALNEAANLRVYGSWVADLTDDVCFAFALIDGVAKPASNECVLIPITVHKDRVIESVKFAMDVTPTMDQCLIALYTVDRDTGLATKWIDLGNVRSKINNLQMLKVIPLPEKLTMQREELVYLAIVQKGDTLNNISCWTKPGSSDVSTGLIPRTLGLRGVLDANNNFLDTIDDGQIQTNTTKYWGAIGLRSEQHGGSRPTQYFEDGFNRLASEGMGQNWLARGGGGFVINNHAPAQPSQGNATAPPNGEVVCSSYVPRLGSTQQQMTLLEGAFDTRATTTMRGLLRGDGTGKGIMARRTTSLNGSRFTYWIEQTDDYGKNIVDRSNGGVIIPASRNPNNQGHYTPVRFTARGNTYGIEYEIPWLQSTSTSTAGTWSFVVPEWADRVDVICLGAGGGGGNGSAGNNNGEGGGAGSWSATTLIRGVNLPGTLTGTVGAGGLGATEGSGTAGLGRPSTAGGATTCGGLLTAAGGLPESMPANVGGAPGSRTVNGLSYSGGAGGSGGPQGINQPPGGNGGIGAGGGGAGGLLIGWGSGGGNGGNGRVWVRAWNSTSLTGWAAALEWVDLNNMFPTSTTNTEVAIVGSPANGSNCYLDHWVCKDLTA